MGRQSQRGSILVEFMIFFFLIYGFSFKFISLYSEYTKKHETRTGRFPQWNQYGNEKK